MFILLCSPHSFFLIELLTTSLILISFFFFFFFSSIVTEKPHQGSQPRLQGFSLKKWVGREKALASAGHVHSLNIPEKLIYMQPAGFALTDGCNGK